LKEDAAGLEDIRKVLSDGRKADEKRLQALVESFYNNLRQFAQIGGKEIILERIEALGRQADANTEKILKKLDELDRRLAETPLPTPVEVDTETRKSLLAKADEAEAACYKGYELLSRYRFSEAIPYLHPPGRRGSGRRSPLIDERIYGPDHLNIGH
jgi:hypothetical protein